MALESRYPVPFTASQVAKEMAKKRAAAPKADKGDKPAAESKAANGAAAAAPAKKKAAAKPKASAPG